MKLIDKDALVAEIDNILDYTDEHWDTDYVIGAQRFADKLQNAIDTLEVKEVDLNGEIEKCLKQYHMLAVGKEDFAPIAKHFFELGVQQSKNYNNNDEIKIGETEIYLEDDGGEPPYDGIQWLDLSCMEYEIPKDKFKDGDNVEIIIRKAQKGE